jgi:uncharacterized Ntn-hydrolase superfamily protein
VTYSIVARDEASGELAVGVQSHWFSVGSLVPWTEPGVGAVAIQSIPEPSHGPRALELMRRGASAPEALAVLHEGDEDAAIRQTAIVDSRGHVAVRTGTACIAHAGDAGGAGFSCQANMMARSTVWAAMARAFSATEGALADRVLAALDAAEAEGGDLRGRQSAALVVVGDRGVDLRVEDHPDPLPELRRLLVLRRAYDLADEADGLVAAGRAGEAGALYKRACALAPENDELLFWAGLGAAQAGDLETALGRVRRAIERSGAWSELLERLDEKLFPAAPAVREALRGRT